MRNLVIRAATVALVLAACRETKAPALPAPGTAAAPRASLRDLEGSVQIKHGEADAWAAAKEGTELSAHDKVRTLRGAKVRIAFEGGTTIQLDEESLVSISPAGEAPSVELLEGRLDADVVAAGGDFQVEAAGGRVRPARGEITFQ